MPFVQVHFSPEVDNPVVQCSLVAALKDGVAAAMKGYGVKANHVTVACSSSPANDLNGYDALVLVEPDYNPERVDHESDIAEALVAALKADPRVVLTCDLRVALTQCAWVTVGEATGGEV